MIKVVKKRTNAKSHNRSASSDAKAYIYTSKIFKIVMVVPAFLQQCCCVAACCSYILCFCCLVSLVCLPLSAMPGNVVVNSTVPRRLRQDGDTNDIYALVKMQMSDTILIQEPLSVWPESFSRITNSFWGKVNTTRNVVQQHLDPERIEELERLRKAIEKDFPHLQRGANYMKSLVDMSKARQPYYKLDFVESAPDASERIALANVQLGARAPPPRPHCLKVVFHRR